VGEGRVVMVLRRCARIAVARKKICKVASPGDDVSQMAK
jgi:hypothetical protein